MMKTPVILVSMFVIFCLWGFSYTKDFFLPPVTTTGAGTMGFLVDGVKWVAHSDDFKLDRTRANFENLGLYISGINNSYSHLRIFLSNPKTGQYQFSSGDKVEYKRLGSFPIFSLDINDPSNNLFITHYDGKIISGTFSFKLKAPDGTIVSITSGRFDITIDH